MMPMLDDARRDLAAVCNEPIVAAVIAHKDPERSGVKKLFGKGKGGAGPKLRHNNWLVLTPTSLRLFALGGRTGMKVKEDLGAFPRASIDISCTEIDRESYWASTGQTMEYRCYNLHVTGHDAAGQPVDVSMDVRAYPGALFGDDAELLEAGELADESDPEIAEGTQFLRDAAAEVRTMVDAIVTGCGPQG